jgi:ribosomal protein S18 acetylase RimI-like enzyme
MEIRPARQEDCDSVAELMLSSGVELYAFIYGMPSSKALHYIRYEFLSGRGFGGYQNVTVVVMDNKVIGVGCFYDGKQYMRLFLGSIVNMLFFYGLLRVWKVFIRSDYVVRHIIQKPQSNELYLTNFAVHPDWQGKGIGSALLAAKIREARTTGYAKFSLDVAANNPRAEALYAKHGLGCIAIKPFNRKTTGFTVPANKKMELKLSDD